jgi:hypothetical protein
MPLCQHVMASKINRQTFNSVAQPEPRVSFWRNRTLAFLYSSYISHGRSHTDQTARNLVSIMNMERRSMLKNSVSWPTNWNLLTSSLRDGYPNVSCNTCQFAVSFIHFQTRWLFSSCLTFLIVTSCAKEKIVWRMNSFTVFDENAHIVPRNNQSIKPFRFVSFLSEHSCTKILLGFILFQKHDFWSLNVSEKQNQWFRLVTVLMCNEIFHFSYTVDSFAISSIYNLQDWRLGVLLVLKLERKKLLDELTYDPVRHLLKSA